MAYACIVGGRRQPDISCASTHSIPVIWRLCCGSICGQRDGYAGAASVRNFGLLVRLHSCDSVATAPRAGFLFVNLDRQDSVCETLDGRGQVERKVFISFIKQDAEGLRVRRPSSHIHAGVGLRAWGRFHGIGYPAVSRSAVHTPDTPLSPGAIQHWTQRSPSHASPRVHEASFAGDRRSQGCRAEPQPMDPPVEIQSNESRARPFLRCGKQMLGSHGPGSAVKG